MRIHYELRNYRCFPDEDPARVVLRPGFTSFVGINNAGKSTLLRSLYELRPFFVQLASQSDAYRSEAMGLPLQGVPDAHEIFSDTNERPLSITLALPDIERSSDLPIPSQFSFTVPRSGGAVGVEATVETQRFTAGGWVSHGDFAALDLGGSALADARPYQVAFSILADTLYIGAFRNALNVGTGEPYYDLQVGQQFIGLWDSFKAGESKENRRAAIRVEAELERIFELSNFEMNASRDGKTLLVRIGNESYTIQEQGAGLAQFIVVLAFSATRRARLILLDEPELNLHPALQLDFLNTLGSFASFGVMFATHSIGLARAGSDQIYSVQRISQGIAHVREFEKTPALAEFIGELSLSGYRELGYSTVLFVEGPTELRVVQRLLRRYRLEHKVVLVPLGGGSMIRPGVAAPLIEVKRLADSVFALIDSERAHRDAELDRDRDGFVQSCIEAGVDCHVLERRAIENYFTERAVRAALGDSYRALGPFEKLSEVEKPWSKTNDNWRVAAELTREELDKTDLGTYLARIKRTVDGA